jgi:hypothetical protein
MALRTRKQPPSYLQECLDNCNLLVNVFYEVVDDAKHAYVNLSLK